MKAPRFLITAIALALLPVGASAQIALPGGNVPSVGLPGVGLPSSLPNTDILPTSQIARDLETVRVDRLGDFVRSNRDAVEYDANRDPAVKGILIATGVDDAAIVKAQAAGFVLTSREAIEGLDLSYARFTAPKGKSLPSAQKALKKLLPDAQIDADNIYFTSGASAAAAGGGELAGGSANGASLGLIDGGVANHPSLSGRVEQKGFVAGAPYASSHGTSVAALMVGKGSVNGGSPGSSLLAADVYGTDKAGGNATAIARALGWLATRNIAVVTISLVGPNNALLKQAVSAAQAKGMIIVAAVGNDGPAAPLTYPASYYGVLAVTGVDAKNKVLPEAGRTSSVAFAAPGAGFSSATGASTIAKVRGTSFAAPLVAGRLARYYARPSVSAVEPAVRRLSAEAVDLGKSGNDPVYGEGLICGNCVVR